MSVMDEPRPQERCIKLVALNPSDDPDGRFCDACLAPCPGGCPRAIYIGWSRSELCPACVARLKEEVADEVRQSLRNVLKQIRGCASCKALGLCDVHKEHLKEIAA